MFTGSRTLRFLGGRNMLFRTAVFCMAFGAGGLVLADEPPATGSGEESASKDGDVQKARKKLREDRKERKDDVRDLHRDERDLHGDRRDLHKDQKDLREDL